MSFRHYGGVNYAAKNNVVKNNYTNANNLNVMTKVGQPNTYINFESDISGNTIYGDLDVSGNLHVAGNIECSGNLHVDGDLDVSGNLHVDGDLDVSGNLTVNEIYLTGPVVSDPNSVVPKSYVDGISAGIHPTIQCQLATAESSIPITLSGIQTIDGIQTQTGYRVLVNNQGYNGVTNIANINNGIYDASSGLWTRASDCSGNNVQGQATFIQFGTTNSKSTFVQTATGASPAIAGTDDLLYQKYSTLNLELGQGLEFVDSNTIQMKSDLSNPAFISSLTVGSEGIYTTNNFTTPTSTLRLVSNNIYNYIESGINTTYGSADLYFTNMNDNQQWMVIKDNGKVGIGTNSPSYNLEVSGNFGTTMDASINSITVGKGGGNKTDNTAVGFEALKNNTTGTKNTALGYQALKNNTTKGANTAIGHQALFSVTDASHNTGVGTNALVSTISGGYNTAVGVNTLYSNSTGSYNTAIGDSALFSYKNSNNTAVGTEAMYSNVNGLYCSAVGFQASYYQTGNSNTSFGFQALFGSTGSSTGAKNCAFGDSALKSNTTAELNTAVGYQALQSNISGEYNVAIGAYALPYATGSANTAIGVRALDGNYSGGYNTAVGERAGYSGSNNCNYCTFVGYQTTTNSQGYNNSTAIGANAQITENNQIVLGTSSEKVFIPGNISVGTTDTYNGNLTVHGELRLYSLYIPDMSSSSDRNVDLSQETTPELITFDGAYSFTIFIRYPYESPGSFVTFRRRTSSNGTCTIKVSDGTAYFQPYNSPSYVTSITMGGSVMSCTLMSDGNSIDYVTRTASTATARWAVIAWVSTSS